MPFIDSNCQDPVYVSMPPDGIKNTGAPSCDMENGTNPIHPTTGNKYQVEVDYKGVSSGALRLDRHYNSQFVSGGSFGRNWRSRYDRRVAVGSTDATLYREDGKLILLLGASGHFETSQAGFSYRLDSDGVTHVLTYSGGNKETYDTQGRLVKLETPHISETITYSETPTGYAITSGIHPITSVADRFGRLTVFSYNTQGLISEVTTPDGHRYRYTYDDKLRLTRVWYPDDTPTVDADNPYREYLYEDSRFGNHLTSIRNAAGVIGATWTYDADGRAITSAHAGNTDSYSVIFNVTGTTTIVDPMNRARDYHFSNVQGRDRMTAASGGACPDCGLDEAAVAYDTDGNILSTTNYRGTVTVFTRDAKGREILRIDAHGTTEERHVATEWRDDLGVPSKMSDGTQSTTFQYDAQGRVLRRTEGAAVAN